jgi:hypothetical protein
MKLLAQKVAEKGSLGSTLLPSAVKRAAEKVWTQQKGRTPGLKAREFFIKRFRGFEKLLPGRKYGAGTEKAAPRG